MAGLNSNTKLLLHCNGSDGSTTFTDESDSNHTVTAVATAQIDTAVKKFGSGSLWLDGNSDYLSIPDSTDWDIFASTSDDWTIDFWVKLNLVGSFDCFFSQASDTSNRFSIEHRIGYGIYIYGVIGGTPFLSGVATGEIADSNWHHIAVVKKANEIGIYKDGNQIRYETFSITATFSSDINIGRHAALGRYVDGQMDEFRIQKSNYFGANPVSGLTDTITAPTEEYAAIVVPIYNKRYRIINT